MKKFTPLFTALFVCYFLNLSAGSPPANNKAQFLFTDIGATQNSWDYALLHYNINDLNTGEALAIPSFLIGYQVKDKAGNVVSMGSGLYISIQDDKLGSEEEYTIVVSTTINGEKLSRSICRTASPKKLAMLIDTKNSDNTACATYPGISYSVTRPKFGNRCENEKIIIEAPEVAADITLDNCNDCGNYRINAGAGHMNYNDQADYRALQKDIQKLTKEGKNVQISVKPSVNINGKQYKEELHDYEITAQSIVEINIPAAIACK